MKDIPELKPIEAEVDDLNNGVWNFDRVKTTINNNHQLLLIRENRFLKLQQQRDMLLDAVRRLINKSERDGQGRWVSRAVPSDEDLEFGYEAVSNCWVKE